MKTLEKMMKILTWASWAVFVYCLLTIENPTGASCVGLVFSATWLITSALLKEELEGDKA